MARRVQARSVCPVTCCLTPNEFRPRLVSSAWPPVWHALQGPDLSHQRTDDQGKEWRWPKKTSKEEADLDELLAIQKANARICSNAAALVDECEEELCKFDSWLVRCCLPLTLLPVVLKPSAGPSADTFVSKCSRAC